jgi:hypothetical protein
MVPDKNFRLQSKWKALLSSVSDKEGKAGWKKMFIQAQMHEEAAARASLKSKDRTPATGIRHSAQGVALD